MLGLYRVRMGMVRMVLDLPTSCPRPEALDAAAAELDERGIRGWKNLELRTTDPTGTALIRHFTFTYWVPAAVTARPPDISYSALWARLDDSHRAALLKLAPATAATKALEHVLALTVGEGFLIRDHWGNRHLPRSFRLFLRTIAAERR